MDTNSSLVENLPVGIFIYNEAGDCIQVNKFGVEIIGGSKDQLLKKNYNHIESWKTSGLLAMADRVMGSGLTESMTFSTHTDFGKDIWIECTLSTELTDHGRVLISTFIDVTEKMETQIALAESEIRFRSLTEASSDWIWEVDKNAVYTYVSPKVHDMLGFKPEEVIGKTPFDFMPPDEAKRVGEIFGPIVSQKLPFANLENTNLHKDGRLVVLETNGVPFFDEMNELAGYRGVDRDITDKKKVEEALQRSQKLDSLGILAGGIAHDFNNLLSGIFGYLEMARDAEDLASAHQDIAKALEIFNRARDLTLQLLTFSKGGSPVKQAGSLISTIKDTANFILSGSSIKAEFDLDADLWICEYDDAQISRVIENLVINAKQATSGRSGSANDTIKISAHNVVLEKDNDQSLPSGKYVMVGVADQGPGISVEDKLRIFDPFFTTKAAGSGLGLSLAYSIIKKHEGAINCLSNPGNGAEFFFFLPAVNKVPTSEKTTVRDEVSLHFGKGKILIMDDESYILDILEKLLSRFGYEVIRSVNGEEALQLFRAHLERNDHIKAAILDLTIPGGKGGKETVSELLALDPDLITIVASGYSSDPILADPKAYGFKASIQKPFKLNELIEGLNKAMS